MRFVIARIDSATPSFAPSPEALMMDLSGNLGQDASFRVPFPRALVIDYVSCGPAEPGGTSTSLDPCELVVDESTSRTGDILYTYWFPVGPAGAQSTSSSELVRISVRPAGAHPYLTSAQTPSTRCSCARPDEPCYALTHEGSRSVPRRSRTPNTTSAGRRRSAP